MVVGRSSKEFMAKRDSRQPEFDFEAAPSLQVLQPPTGKGHLDPSGAEKSDVRVAGPEETWVDPGKSPTRSIFEAAPGPPASPVHSGAKRTTARLDGSGESGAVITAAHVDSAPYHQTPTVLQLSADLRSDAGLARQRAERQAAGTSTWREVPQARFLSWPAAMQRAYCAARDRDSAEWAENDGWRRFYLERAENYRSASGSESIAPAGPAMDTSYEGPA